MSLARSLRHRRSLIQFDPRQTFTSPGQHPHRVKRALAQQVSSNPSSVPKHRAPMHSPHHQPFRAPRGSGGRSTHPSFAHHVPHHHTAFGAPSSSRNPRWRPSARPNPPRKLLDGPLRDEAYIVKTYNTSPIPIKSLHENTPKSSLGNFAMHATGKTPTYEFVEGVIQDSSTHQQIWRTTVTIEIEPPVIGIGDSSDKKTSEKLAALSAVYQLHGLGVLDNLKKLKTTTQDQTEVTLSDSTVVTYDRARSFMDYYCRRFGFGKPEVAFREVRKPSSGWEAVMTVNDRRIGLGTGSTKKAAQTMCYLDVTQYLESCDAQLWKDYVEAAKTGADLGMAPKVVFTMSDALNEDIRILCADIKRSTLYRNRPATQNTQSDAPLSTIPTGPRYRRRVPSEYLVSKSKQLLKAREDYLANPNLEKMRAARMALPVYGRANDLLAHFRDHEVSICMAATGSGKTTQIPQLILDDYIFRGEGAHCNIICTQPRRLAAISVADRVAKERGEHLGQSIGYQVRFEAKLPEEHGSITFCTTGILLKKLQSALSANGPDRHNLDDVTHVVVDEVHERDVDTDLLLVVLKRLLADRKVRGKSLKIVLMSATIDPTLFQNYFPDENGAPAGVIDIPGRSYPVAKNFLEDFVPALHNGITNWIFAQDSVTKYLSRELDPYTLASLNIAPPAGAKSMDNREEDPELPYPLIAATISHVLQRSGDGHVLVFLPGWDEITATQRALQQPMGPLGVDFLDKSKYSIHLLHSTIPLAEQQVIFEPPLPGVRRIILATNIAETSVTIPDVVYVVDTARSKEQRFDPERHMSSLVSAWVGSSNLNQRAGRAGRHRPGEYFGIIGTSHATSLHPYQTVEMKRVDLSNVVMHVKALNFPGMSVEEVLAATIEAPHHERVSAAIKSLQMVGALDNEKNLTSLGRVLLQLPVEVQVGRLVLYGSFFRCLDQALTLAAILTNRDPFVSPMHLKEEAAAKKVSWTPQEFRSDALATLQAYNAWWALQSSGEYVRANKFCMDNFLAKPTLLMIQKIKHHLLQSLYHAGVIGISAGGRIDPSGGRSLAVPPELNVNGDSLPLLAALIASASQPKYAIRVGEKSYRTSQDKVTFIHPSSVNHRKRVEKETDSIGEKQLFAFSEKRQNVSTGAGNAQTFLVTTTRLDPMTYMLFGAYKLVVTERWLECDNWLPIVPRTSGDLDALDDVQRLKTLMEACMLRVFEGIAMSRRHRGAQAVPILPREEESEFDDDDDRRDYTMSQVEVRELDRLTSEVVQILNRYSEERLIAQSRQNSRPATPMVSPSLQSLRLPGGTWSGYSTPGIGSAYNSRPGTPSRLSSSRRFHI